HSEQGIKPVTELAREALGDEVGGKPLLPVFAVAVIAQGRVGHKADVEPGVPDVRNPVCHSIALAAANFNQIYPWPMGRVTFEPLPASHSAVLEFFTTANDVKSTAAVANPDRQRKPPVALL